MYMYKITKLALASLVGYKTDFSLQNWHFHMFVVTKLALLHFHGYKNVTLHSHFSGDIFVTWPLL